MILKILIKLTFLKKLNKNIASNLFSLIILLDDAFLKFRISFLSIFLKKNSKIKKALLDLKENGVAVIQNYYREDEVRRIEEECLSLLNRIPIEKVKNINYIEQACINIDEKVLYVEKLGKSIKIKGLNLFNSFFNKIGKKIELSIISLVYQLASNKPYVLYNVTHDGSASHPVLKDHSKKKTNEAIAGKPHVDLFLHKLRCFIALNDINFDNGATIYFNKSSNSKILKKNYINLFLDTFGFTINKNQSHYIDNSQIDELEKSCPKQFLNCKKGDLALIDLKTAHYAVLPRKGERHLLWFYY